MISISWIWRNAALYVVSWIVLSWLFGDPVLIPLREVTTVICFSFALSGVAWIEEHYVSDPSERPGQRRHGPVS
jgi:hypothetical protein